MFGCSAGGTEPKVPVTPYGSPRLTWGPCPDDLGGSSVQCTQAEVPLDWDEAQSPTTSILLRRVQGGQETLGRLWLLDGGPGFAGDDFLNETVIGLARDAKLDLMVPSHRGTIGQSAFRCGGQRPDSEEGGRVTPSEWPACLAELEDEWGKGLPAFTVRQAALDVAYLIGLPSRGEKNYVFGGSYGSLWAHRLLLDTDARLDAVLLDSIVPIFASLEWVDAHADRAAEAILNACSEIEACQQRFDGDPVALGRAAIFACGQGQGCGGDRISAADIQHEVAQLLNGPPDEWIKLTSLFERLVRCSSDDEGALIRRVLSADGGGEALDHPTPELSVKYNPLLNRQILYRELYRFDVTQAERDEFEASALAMGTNSSLVALEASAFGASYRHVDEPAREVTSVPTYLLSGRFDPLDPPSWADQFAQSLSFGRVSQVPWAGHSTLRYLGWNEGGCGRKIFSSFLSGEIDLDCIDSQPTVDLGMEFLETQQMVETWWSEP